MDSTIVSTLDRRNTRKCLAIGMPRAPQKLDRVRAPSFCKISQARPLWLAELLHNCGKQKIYKTQKIDTLYALNRCSSRTFIKIHEN